MHRPRSRAQYRKPLFLVAGVTSGMVLFCVVAVIAVVALWCDSESGGTVAAPDSAYIARIDYSDCGAMGAPGYTIVRIEHERVARWFPGWWPWRPKSHTVFEVEGYALHDITIRWQSATALVIQYPAYLQDGRYVRIDDHWEQFDIVFDAVVEPGG